MVFFVFSSRRRHTRCLSDWSSDVCSSDLGTAKTGGDAGRKAERVGAAAAVEDAIDRRVAADVVVVAFAVDRVEAEAARQAVVASPALQQIVPDPAEELVVARPAAEDVVAALAVDDVVAFAPFEGLAADPESAAGGAVGGGGDRPGDDRVVPAPGLDGLDPGRGDDHVIAGGPVGRLAPP